MSETRKLAAILCSDVVGYSRLGGADEDRIFARLRPLRSDRIDPTIAVHHGRVVKRTGDGSIVEFRSVIDALRCGIEVQNAMIESNSGLPDGERIVFRFGIHVGDPPRREPASSNESFIEAEALEHRDRDWRSPAAGNGTWPSLRMPKIVPAALQSTL
jgi:class 3 adenylate cyclase